MIEAVFEMVGGKGPSDVDILKMLDEADSDSSEGDDHNNNDETTEEPAERGFDSVHGEENYKLYEELKDKLNKGLLKLCKSRDLDLKLLFLLETDSLQPYELIRLGNLWERLNKWTEEPESEFPKKNLTQSKSSKIARFFQSF